MQVFKTLVVALIVVISTGNLIAQSKLILSGKWTCPYEMEGEKGIATYEFKEDGGAINAYSLLFETENGSTYSDNDIVLKDIDFSDGKGKASCIVKEDGEIYEINAQLTLINSNTLKIQYSAWGYSEKEIWKRKK